MSSSSRSSIEVQGRPAQERLKSFLEDCWGSTLQAWLSAFDVDNVQRIQKIEFIEIMRRQGYSGNLQQLFHELEDDSGELSMHSIDPVQAELWTRFREWCRSTFRSVEDLLTRFGNSNEERMKNRQTIKARSAPLTGVHFRKRMRELGWDLGDEDLLFSALDADRSGVLKREHFRWLDAEFRRIQRKIDAKSHAIHSLRKQQEKDAHQETLELFKQALVKKYGNLVRAWRNGLSNNDLLILPKTQFLKACSILGWAHEARELYKMLDKEQSGIASLEELDPSIAEHLAKFKKFLESKFGSALQAFDALFDTTNSGGKVSFGQFGEALRECGWSGRIKMTFNSLDRQGRKSLEESDFRMLDKWSPSPYFMVEANTLAKEEVKDLLKQKYHGHFMKAWRHLLDKDGSNRVNWSEFQTACQKLRYHGDVAGAWRAFDSDLSGYLTLNEIDTEASDTLCEFKDWAWNEFGTVRAAFGVFDHDGSNSLSFEEFRGNCRIYGYEGNARKLFDALDINGERSLSISEIAFLDDWDMGKAEEGEKSKTDKRKSRIRQMNESVKRHESKGRVSQKRLTELPMRLIASIRENMGDRMDELGRLQKVVQVKQALQLRADLPLIPFHHWPISRGEEEEAHCPYHCEQRKDRERKHWVQEADRDFIPVNCFGFQQASTTSLGSSQAMAECLEEADAGSEFSQKLPSALTPSVPKLLKPTLDDLLASGPGGSRLRRLPRLVLPRLPSMRKLMDSEPHTVR
ncbi:unnamed protein product [Durusdinium trenchii]|uniref:EF-hand domain-containing protein n=1 Tax=Durusdinium trenchii TaxID=1381693 RepID=A0ABP0HTC9_9DINO